MADANPNLYLPPPLFEFLWFHLPGLEALEASIAAWVLRTVASTLTTAVPDAATYLKCGAAELDELALAQSQQG